jgi:hypothetical protein
MLIWMYLAPHRMPNWNPVSSAVYTGRSLLDTWNPEYQLYWNPERSYPARLEFVGRGLAHMIHCYPERQLLHTCYTLGCCHALEGLCY